MLGWTTIVSLRPAVISSTWPEKSCDQAKTTLTGCDRDHVAELSVRPSAAESGP